MLESNCQPNEDALFFVEENDKEVDTTASQNWKILIADDDLEVHTVTQLALHNFNFEGKKIYWLDAYSGKEAKELIAKNSDVAIILLDVIMETEDAGLEVVKYIREKLKNKIVRIVIRTGQQGKFPESEVIKKYDINDYKSKTELTREKLLTELTSKLREFQTLFDIIQENIVLAEKVHNQENLYQELKEYAQGLELRLAEVTRQ